VKTETQPIVTANAEEAGVWKIESKTNGVSMPINVNRESGGHDGLHLAGDNKRLVPWTSSSEASQWYIELVKEVPVAVSDAGYTTLNLPFAYSLPEGVKAYVVKAPTLLNDVMCLYIEEIATEDGIVPANTPVVLAAEAGDYMLQFVNDEVDAVTADQAWKGTLRAAKVDGSVYTLSGAEFVKGTNKSVSANKAYYVAEFEAEALPMTTEMGVEVGVTSVDASAEEVDFYDLSGRKVLKPVSGIYVVNGKKVLVERY
jgi:hypothetical protein